MARVLKWSQFLPAQCTPTRSSAIGMSHTCLCLLSYSWYSFTDPGGMEGWVGLGIWLHSETVYLPEPLLTGLNVEQLRWSRPMCYRYTKPPTVKKTCRIRTKQHVEDYKTYKHGHSSDGRWSHCAAGSINVQLIIGQQDMVSHSLTGYNTPVTSYFIRKLTSQNQTWSLNAQWLFAICYLLAILLWCTRHDHVYWLCNRLSAVMCFPLSHAPSFDTTTTVTF